MDLKKAIKQHDRKIKKMTEKLRKAFKDGSSIRRRANLRARLDNLCEERDFYKRKLSENNK